VVFTDRGLGDDDGLFGECSCHFIQSCLQGSYSWAGGAFAKSLPCTFDTDTAVGGGEFKLIARYINPFFIGAGFRPFFDGRTRKQG